MPFKTIPLFFFPVEHIASLGGIFISGKTNVVLKGSVDQNGFPTTTQKFTGLMVHGMAVADSLPLAKNILIMPMAKILRHKKLVSKI